MYLDIKWLPNIGDQEITAHNTSTHRRRQPKYKIQSCVFIIPDMTSETHTPEPHKKTVIKSKGCCSPSGCLDPK
jgi:hypothetical protein